MTLTILSLVILSQIALFQFLSALANRSLVRQELRSLNGFAPELLVQHSRRAPVIRMTIGTILVLISLLPWVGIPGDPGMGKLILAGVSILSAIAFTVANARDRKMMRLLADLSPGGSVRRASLEVRSLRQWYHPAIEAVPIVLFIATLLFLVSAPEFVSTGSAPGNSALAGERTHILVLFGLQGLMVFGGLYYSLRKGLDVQTMAAHIPSLRRRPEVALRLGEQMAGTQLRFFMFARIAVVMMLGTKVVEHVLETTGAAGASLWDTAGWGLIGVLLITFFFYLRKVGRISREMQNEMEPANHNTAGAG